MSNHSVESLVQEFSSTATLIRELEGSGGDATQLWMNLDENVGLISQEVPSDCIYSAALNLLNTEDGYQKNIGLGLFCTESCIADILAHPDQLDEVISIARGFYQARLVEESGPPLYNLIWSVELLLRLHQKANPTISLRIQEELDEIPSQNYKIIKSHQNNIDLEGTSISKLNLGGI